MRRADDQLESPQGIFHWLGGGRRGLEAWLYVAHRVSGVALLAFLVMHVFFTAGRLFGQETWERLMAFSRAPAVQFAEYLVFAAFAFHAVNGIRLILVELALAVGRPDQPVFPYRGSLHRQRPLALAAMIVTALIVALGGFELLRFPH